MHEGLDRFQVLCAFSFFFPYGATAREGPLNQSSQKSKKRMEMQSTDSTRHDMPKGRITRERSRRWASGSKQCQIASPIRLVVPWLCSPVVAYSGANIDLNMVRLPKNYTKTLAGRPKSVTGLFPTEATSRGRHRIIQRAGQHARLWRGADVHSSCTTHQRMNLRSRQEATT